AVRPVVYGRQVLLSPRSQHAPGCEVEEEIAQLQLGLAGALAEPRGVAQRHADASQELADAEGLREVVVGARVEGLDLVALLAPGGEDDDRHARPLAQP